MKTHRLQEAFARKREVEHMRTERTAEVDRYYTHWGKVTSKFENWTTPAYYEQAEEKLRISKEMKEKNEKLNERREKLRVLLSREKIAFENQLASLRQPKSRRLSNNVMKQLDENFKQKQDERRRLELEAKLYGRWRHGIDDESILYESKTNNQALAKLNWLDKQIEEQVQKEQDEKTSLQRSLQLQEEIRKTEYYHKERQQIREKEITEIRALQEKHVEELKEREREADSLKSEAYYIQNSLDHLTSELNKLCHLKPTEKQEAHLSHNLRKIKMTIRNRSEAFREQLQSDIDLLRRVNTYCPGDKVVCCLIEKLQQQRDSEMNNLAKIENMYESEAKVNLHNCVQTWDHLTRERHLDLTNLLKDLHNTLSIKFYENQLRQKDLIDVRATHLSSIANSNERLKLLVQEEEDNPTPLVVETPRSVRDELPCKPLQHVSSSFTNLNLDCLGGGEVASQPYSARSQLVATPDSSQTPKFGRKKVAWV